MRARWRTAADGSTRSSASRGIEYNWRQRTNRDGGPAHKLCPFESETVKARIKWIENVSFVAEADSGHAIVMDGAPEGGGRNLGPRPMETVLMGAGGCTAYDVVHILRKSRAPITGCVVEIDAERAAEDPQVF